MNISDLAAATADDESWDWASCCVCGERPTDFGLYLTGTALPDGPDLHSLIVRVAWCDDKGCVEDRIGTPYMAVPEEVTGA